ncbi:drug efflux system protein MdtG [compost metagenome]
MKTALWLYLFLFIAFFDLHAQYPILTPFAISLGAAPTFIGWMMGIYSLTHLPGNLLAGPGVDRHGSRRYIMFSLTAAGFILMLQAFINSPWELLVLRACSGFVLAFLSPACMTLLARLSNDPVTQGKYMSGHGVVHTLASVISPAAGAFIVASLGFQSTFSSLGIILILTGIMAYFTLPKSSQVHTTLVHEKDTDTPLPNWRYFLLPLVIACAQGILFYELPLRNTGTESILSTGILFSVISLGGLVTLSMLFLNNYSPLLRLVSGMLLMALCFFYMAAFPDSSLVPVLFVLGTAKGIIFPAMAALFIRLGGNRLGRIFALHSIFVSVGSFIGPVVAGQLRDQHSPFFMAFLIMTCGMLFLPLRRPTPVPPLSTNGS